MNELDRQRWLVKLLQLATEEKDGQPQTWRELVHSACQYGAKAHQPARPWEFDALRTVTIAGLYETRDDSHDYLTPPATREDT